jgi:hypothetical protein
MRTTKEQASRLTARTFSLPLRVITAAIVTLAVAAAMTVTAGTAGAATISTATCHASNYEQIDGRCLQIAHTEPLSPAARDAFEKAFSTPAGRAGLEKAFDEFDGSKVGLAEVSSPKSVHSDWNCPGGTSCGLSGSGGEHFWVIASYASIYNVGFFPFWLACTGALSPVIDPVAAVAACGVVDSLLWALVNNAPWTTHHGVWLAIYRNYWTDGLW